MNNLFIILRAVTALIIFAKRLNVQEFISPASFYWKVKRDVGLDKKDVYTSVYLEKSNQGWRKADDEGEAVLIAQANSKIDCAITTKVLINKIWHSHIWTCEEFEELDTYIIIAIIRYISTRISGLPSETEIITKSYLTNELIEQSGILFQSTTQFAENRTTTTVRVSVDGVEIETQRYDKPTEIITFPWHQVLQSLQ